MNKITLLIMFLGFLFASLPLYILARILKEKSPKKANSHIVNVDYFKVLRPHEIADMEKPVFSKASESDYKAGLESVQPLIDEYEGKGFISIPVINTYEDISATADERKWKDSFINSYKSVGEMVKTEKGKDGLYRVTTNGHHRMYVAHKYGLKILVHVDQEELDAERP